MAVNGYNRRIVMFEPKSTSRLEIGICLVVVTGLVIAVCFGCSEPERIGPKIVATEGTVVGETVSSMEVDEEPEVVQDEEEHLSLGATLTVVPAAAEKDPSAVVEVAGSDPTIGPSALVEDGEDSPRLDSTATVAPTVPPTATVVPEIVWHTPTPVSTPAWSLPIESGDELDDSPTITVEAESEGEDEPGSVTVEKTVECFLVTGACHELEARSPIQVTVNCESQTIEIVEVSESGTRPVGMCAPGLRIISDVELEYLRKRLTMEGVEVGLGIAWTGSHDSIVITGVDRIAAGEDERCGGVPSGFECLRVELEITNISMVKDVISYQDDAFRVTDSSGVVYAENPGLSALTESLSDFFNRSVHVLGGERISTAIVRYVPLEVGELHLSFDGGARFLLGEAEAWSAEGVSMFETRSKGFSHTTMACGLNWMFTEVIQGTGHTFGIDEYARCDANVVILGFEELARLRNAVETETADRLQPVDYRQHFKTFEHAIRITDVTRHENGGPCGDQIPQGHVCVGAEVEITNLSSGEEFRGYRDREFWLAGRSGFVYRDGPGDLGLSRYRNGEPKVPPGQRLLTRIARYVPATEEDLTLVYDGNLERNAVFSLSDDVPDFEQSAVLVVPTASDPVIRDVGRWLGAAVPVGQSLVVGDFEFRVVEVERGWKPDESCCAETVPEALVSFPQEMASSVIRGTMVRFKGGTREDFEATKSFLADLEPEQAELYRVDEFKEVEGPTEYVRVRFNARILGGINRKSTFNAANVILADSQRRVFESSFYPQPQIDLRAPTGPYRNPGLSLSEGHGPRLAEMYGGGSVSEEVAWLIPSDAQGLTLVYIPVEHEGGGFFALDETRAVTSSIDEDALAWVEDSIELNGTWYSRPAPMTTGAMYTGDGVGVRVVEVSSWPSSCIAIHAPVDGRECVRIKLEVAVGGRDSKRELFASGGVQFFIDDEAITVTRQLDETTHSPIVPNFGSVLDWAEVDGLGSFQVVYAAEVPVGWRNGVLAYSPLWATPPVFLLLTDADEVISREFETDQEVDVRATVTAVSKEGVSGLLEYLYLEGFEFDEEDEAAGRLIGLALVCAGFVGQVAGFGESEVKEAALGLSNTRVGEFDHVYFERLDDAAVTCGRAFPESSMAGVLYLLVGIAQVGCLFGGQQVFDYTPATAMEIGEVLFGYWGEDAPLSMADIEGPAEFCTWAWNEDSEELRELRETANLAVFGIAQ